MVLTARKQRILQIIVDEYVSSPVPVSSDQVARKIDMPVSSATIRNDMSALENDGYIIRPHSSAGGVPSDTAYRVYVELLTYALTPSPQMQGLIWSQLKQAHNDLEAWGKMAAQLMAGMVRTVAMATLPQVRESRWKHLYMVCIEEYLALLVVVLGESRLRQKLLTLKQPKTQEELTEVSNKLNHSFAGFSRGQINAARTPLNDIEMEATNAAISLLEEEERQGVPTHYVDGLRHMLSYPELSGGLRARQIAELVEDQELVRSFIEETPDAGVVRVTIGKENRKHLLRPFSVVFAQYGVPLEATGIIGVVGPSRMAYSNAISTVSYFSSVMSRMVRMAQPIG